MRRSTLERSHPCRAPSVARQCTANRCSDTPGVTQEMINKQLLLCQVVCAMSILRRGPPVSRVSRTLPTFALLE